MEAGSRLNGFYGFHNESGWQHPGAPMKTTNLLPKSPPEERNEHYSGDGASRADQVPALSPKPPRGPVDTSPPGIFDELRNRTRPRKPHKAPGFDLKSQYRITLEVGLVLALLLLFGLTTLNMEVDRSLDVPVYEQQEVVEMQEIQQTQQVNRPPPPPRPPAPVEVPNDQVIEDEVIDLDASLDLNEAMDVQQTPPPPPPPEESADEEPGEEEIFIAVEEKPELIGGMKSLQSRIEYPKVAKKAGIEGRVFVQFIVDKNGNVTDPVVLRSPHKLLSEEALRVIRTAKFKPGKQRTKPVKVRMALPISFRLKNMDQ